MFGLIIAKTPSLLHQYPDTFCERPENLFPLFQMWHQDTPEAMTYSMKKRNFILYLGIDLRVIFLRVHTIMYVF